MKSVKKLNLKKEVLSELTTQQLEGVIAAGDSGGTCFCITNTCTCNATNTCTCYLSQGSCGVSCTCGAVCDAVDNLLTIIRG